MDGKRGMMMDKTLLLILPLVMLNHTLWAIKPLCKSLQSNVSWSINITLYKFRSCMDKESISNYYLQHIQGMRMLAKGQS